MPSGMKIRQRNFCRIFPQAIPTNSVAMHCSLCSLKHQQMLQHQRMLQGPVRLHNHDVLRKELTVCSIALPMNCSHTSTCMFLPADDAAVFDSCEDDDAGLAASTQSAYKTCAEVPVKLCTDKTYTTVARKYCPKRHAHIGALVMMSRSCDTAGAMRVE